MNVIGPDWPSTAALKAALATLPGPDLRWGAGGADATTQLQAFTKANIPCPEFTTSLDQAKQWVRAGIRTFGRRLHHTQGSDIIGPGYKPGRAGTANTQRLRWITTRKGNRVQRLRTLRGTMGRAEKFNSEFTRRDFWVKVIDSVAEYRQHIWDGHAIRVGKKVQSEKPWRKQPVRSRSNGWTIDYGWKSPSEDFTSRIRALAKAAVAAVGYIGGAVDILEGRDGKLYVLEVNSAPSLRDENTLGVYVQAITRWVKREAKKKPKA